MSIETQDKWYLAIHLIPVVNLELIFKDAYPNLSSRLYIEIGSNKNEEEEKCCKTFGSKN